MVGLALLPVHETGSRPKLHYSSVLPLKYLGSLIGADLHLVTRLDRLARSTRDLLNILDSIGKAGAGFLSLHDAWADTMTPHGRHMLTVLGGLTEF